MNINALKACTDAQQAYYLHVDEARRSGEKAWAYGTFEDWWRGLVGLPRMNVATRKQRLIDLGVVPADYFTSSTRGTKEHIVPTKTKRNQQARNGSSPISPFSIENVDEAYKVYLNGPWASAPNFTKPGIAKFRKMHAQRYKAPTDATGRKLSTVTNDAERHGTLGTRGGHVAQPDMGEYTSNGITEAQFNAFSEDVQEALIDSGAYVPRPEQAETQGGGETLNQVIAALVAAKADPSVIAATVAAMEGAHETTQGTQQQDTTTYRQRKANNEVPDDAARNAVLWALNAEGLLGEALEAADDAGFNYVTQEIGQTILSDVFGPLPPRNQGNGNNA